MTRRDPTHDDTSDLWRYPLEDWLADDGPEAPPSVSPAMRRWLYAAAALTLACIALVLL